MGPIFNPFYWLCGLTFLLLATTAAVACFWLAKARRVSLPVAVIIAVSVFFLIFCSLCQWSLSGPPAPSVKPVQEDIVGIWQMTPVSIQRMKEKGRYKISTHTLEFKEDGTFIMTNMPDWWSFDNFGESTGKFDSGSGRWIIEKDINGEWSIGLQFNVLNEQEKKLVTWFNLRGHQSPYIIYIWIGDPDSGDTVEFERRSVN